MARKSFYTKKLGQAVAKAAQTVNAGRYHVISAITGTDRWAVVPDGSVAALKLFSTQTEAVEFASKTASKKTGEVVIHGKDGQVKDKISFAQQ